MRVQGLILRSSRQTIPARSLLKVSPSLCISLLHYLRRSFTKFQIDECWTETLGVHLHPRPLLIVVLPREHIWWLQFSIMPLLMIVFIVKFTKNIAYLRYFLFRSICISLGSIFLTYPFNSNSNKLYLNRFIFFILYDLWYQKKVHTLPLFFIQCNRLRTFIIFCDAFILT